MLKLILRFVKKFVLSVLFIYVYNQLSLPLNIVIPINLITVFMFYICGLPSILMLILFSLIYI